MPCSYICDCCDTPKSFATLYSLQRHSQRGVKLFKCQYPDCGQTYTQRSFCDDHERKIHLKIKDVKCPACDELFWSRADANHHFHRDHPQQLFRCALSFGRSCTHRGAIRPTIILAHTRKSHPGVDATTLLVSPADAVPAIPLIIQSSLSSSPLAATSVRNLSLSAAVSSPPSPDNPSSRDLPQDACSNSPTPHLSPHESSSSTTAFSAKLEQIDSGYERMVAFLSADAESFEPASDCASN
ncbi:hypothetical protein DL93DRAFT_1708322 [Clavulina sp. PMI_390]|nr:hypothetical protein DL93DRAFT_1708322 [Clavulina sp. PMI_390]